MIKLETDRQTAEELWELLMDHPERMLHDITAENFAKYVAQRCGFSHEKACEMRKREVA